MDNLASRCAWAITIIPMESDFHDLKITDISLAKKLGTDKNTLARYRKQENIPMGKVIDNLISLYNFNPMWLFKGEGEPFPGARAKYPDVCGQLPAEPLIVCEAPAGYRPSVSEADAIFSSKQKINIEEAMGKTYKVLSAGTALSVALYMNIQQFAAALDTGEALKLCQDQMKDMQEQINSLNARIDGLTAPSTAERLAGAGSEKEAM